MKSVTRIQITDEDKKIIHLIFKAHPELKRNENRAVSLALHEWKRAYLNEENTYYPILLQDLGNPGRYDIIKVLREPGKALESGEEKLIGWLGTTNDNISKTALGKCDADGLRKLLLEYNVGIELDTPVRYVTYAVGGSRAAEHYNYEYAYPYQGPWMGVTPEGEFWCDDLATVKKARVVIQNECVIIAFSDGKEWFVFDSCPKKTENMEERAREIVGLRFDREKFIRFIESN